MWLYGVKGKNLQAFDIRSIKELKEVKKKFDWVWLDCLEPSPKDFELISQIVGFKPSELEELKGGKTFPHPRKVNEHTFFSISHVTIHGETLKTYPIYIFLNQKTLITLSKKESSAPIEHTLQALKDSLPEGQNIGPSFILCEISQENTNKNLEAVMAFREAVEELEEKSIAKPSKESIKKVFALKKQITMFYRILWNEQQILNSLKNGLVPKVRLCAESISSLEDSVNDISRELEFLNSYDSALDGVLGLLDLSLIHRVERTLVYLTIVTVIMNLILILL